MHSPSRNIKSYPPALQRLNAFGFLNSEDLAVRAETKQDVSLNLGYLDQRLALQWVQTHIGKFGGDPTKVGLSFQSSYFLRLIK